VIACLVCKRVRSPHLKIVQTLVDGVAVKLCETCDKSDFARQEALRRVRAGAS
jgi:hypothetical protein